MIQDLSQLHSIFNQARENVQVLMNMLTPFINNVNNEPKRMLAHHMFEEEEYRANELNQFIPKLQSFIESGQIDPASREFISLLQEINHVKFGVHNFMEHLELAMLDFFNEEQNQVIQSILDQTKPDYMAIKDSLSRLNETFPSVAQSSPIQMSEQHDIASAAHGHSVPLTNLTPSPVLRQTKRLSVGSLKGIR